MVADTHKHLAMLKILYGACSAALNAFQAADNPVDEQLVIDLEAMVRRTRAEIERLDVHFANLSEERHSGVFPELRSSER